MTVVGIAFDEILLPFGSEEFKLQLAQVGGNDKVPVLIDGENRIWESLAILEYLADKFPAAALWPDDMAERAHARAVASEMHAGFAALRRHLPMNMARQVIKRKLSSEVAADVQRIEALWANCHTRYGGPFLFGDFGAADAMYAPVVSRFHTYDVDVTPGTRAYLDAVIALPAWRQWSAAAVKEPWVCVEEEVDWPQVPRA